MKRTGPQTVDPARPRTLVTPRGDVVRQPQIDDPELAAMRAVDAARDEELAAFGPKGKQRLRNYILGACVGFPLANFILIGGGFAGLWLQLLLGVAWGTYVALCRPGTVLCALATLGVGMVIASYNGTDGAFHSLLALIIFGTAGALVGFRENDKQIDR